MSSATSGTSSPVTIPPMNGLKKDATHDLGGDLLREGDTARLSDPLSASPPERTPSHPRPSSSHPLHESTLDNPAERERYSTVPHASYAPVDEPQRGGRACFGVCSTPPLCKSSTPRPSFIPQHRPCPTGQRCGGVAPVGHYLQASTRGPRQSLEVPAVRFLAGRSWPCNGPS